MNSNNPNVQSMFPLSAALGLQFVSTSLGADHPGFDSEEVKAKLGTTRYSNLSGRLTHVFCCGHRHYPGSEGPSRAGCEVLCIYASDLEAFLKAGG